MEQLVNFNRVASLEEITLVEVASCLCGSEIPRPAGRHSFRNEVFCPEYFRQENSQTVGLKVAQLLLPETCNTKLFKLIKQMDQEICYWWQELARATGNVKEWYLHNISWTQQGLVDKRRTIERLLEKNEALDLTEQFKLARVFCIEDQVWSLLRKLSKTHIESLYRAFTRYQDELQLLWLTSTLLDVDISLVERSASELGSYYAAFRHAATSRDTEGTVYFFEKLTQSEVQNHLVETTVEVTKLSIETCPEHVHVVRYLLSRMNATQQLETFKKDPANVLLCFHHWPLHQYFMDVANCIWEFLPEADFYAVLNIILCAVPKDLYQKLFEEFWLKSLSAHKKYVTGNVPEFYFTLWILISVHKQRNTSLVLNSASTQEKEDLMFSSYGKRMCSDLICNGNWAGLKFLLKECIHSSSKLLQFRDEFTNCEPFKELVNFQDEKRKWNELTDEVLKERFI